MQGKKYYTPKLFTSFQLPDRIPEDNFYRCLRDAIDLRWLYKETAKYYGTEGQESIDPIVFFRLMLIGYLENIGSDRQIIRTASLRLDMLYFIGYNIDEALPWHSTLSRTRQLYGEELFKKLFRQILQQCIDKGMVSGKRQCIDSVLVKANASMDGVIAKEILEDAEQYADELKEDDRKEQDKGEAAKQNGLKVCNKDKTQDETADKSSQSKKRLRNETHYSPADPDARISTKTNKPVHLNYLGQVSVDAAHHVITNIEAHHADKRDSDCLIPVLIHTINNLKEAGDIKVETVICDGNYSSGKTLQYLEQETISGYIPSPGQYKKEREGFIYNAEEDYYTCSQGAILTYKNTYPDRDGYLKKEYRSNAKECSQCPLRKQCLGAKSRQKKITDTVDKPLYERMDAKMQTPKGQRMKKIRQSTAEPVIGTLVTNLAMRKVNTKGIEQANKCMIMAAVAYNIKKMMKWASRRTKIYAAAIKETTEKKLSKQISVLRNLLALCSNKLNEDLVFNIAMV